MGGGSPKSKEPKREREKKPQNTATTPTTTAIRKAQGMLGKLCRDTVRARERGGMLERAFRAVLSLTVALAKPQQLKLPAHGQANYSGEGLSRTRPLLRSYW